MKIFRHSDETSLAKRDGESGQAALELMMVFPIFIFIVLMALDFGIWMYQSVTISNAVREAARFGAVNCASATCTDSDVAQRAVDSSSGALVAAEVDVGWVDRDGDAAAGGKRDSIVVKADHTYNLLFLPVSVPITSCADMRLEKTNTGAVTAGTDC